MTGLNLETYLHLLRADLGAWASLGMIVLLLALLCWTSWGSRRALRKCLVLSIVAHVGLALYGSTYPIVGLSSSRSDEPETSGRRIRQIRVSPQRDGLAGSSPSSADGRSGRNLAAWDRPGEPLALADPGILPDHPEPEGPVPVRRPPATPPAPEATAPEVSPPEPSATGARPVSETAETSPPAPPTVAPTGPDEVAAPLVKPGDVEVWSSVPVPDRGRLLPGRGERDAPAAEIARLAPSPSPLPETAPPEASSPATSPEDRAISASAPPPDRLSVAPAERTGTPKVARSEPEALALAMPGDGDLRPRIGRPADAAGRTGVRPPSDAPTMPRPSIPSAPAPVPGALDGPLGGAVASDSERPGGPGGGRVELPPVLPGALDAASGAIRLPRPAPLPALALAEADVRARSRPARQEDGRALLSTPDRLAHGPGPVAVARVTPRGLPSLPEVRGAAGGRPLADIPEVYRSRLDPNRSTLAQRAGASPASEQAVERALDWLTRHQDADGRWDAGVAKDADGRVVRGHDSFTAHCPPGAICAGECIYWEADTAVTGLALLAYLGAGYTHTDGKYAETVGKGLDFLLLTQKPDGDLRGTSKAVGMYCHAMAALALCEAYALTGDARLRVPVERAVSYLARSRARDGLSWRYEPGAAIGDTSILGWVVLVLKSAKVVGIPVDPAAPAGALGWLRKVADGSAQGLAKYQPGRPVDPTMTAEAWVCRQFLGAGGPGPASTEASKFLLEHGPARDPYNIYYWYYGTLAMYQDGGDAWTRWNAQVRDELVRRQRIRGHQAGSWDPDDSKYGSLGGRIYGTALATLTLEVYYRYLRLYDEPKSAPILAPAPERPIDPTLRRAGNAARAGRR